MKASFKLQVLQTSDVHGYVYPTSYSTMQEHAMGLAKISTLMNTIQKEQSLRIDTGDTIQGSPLTYYFAKKGDTHIHPMAKAMNHLKYNYITIGNHEFNYGLNNLTSYLDHVDATILNCNILDDTTKQPYRGVTYDIRSFEDGPKVALIGVTTHYIPNWEQPDHIANLDIRDAFETINSIVQKLRSTVDYIIVSYHGGFERNFETFELDVEDTGENQGSKMLLEIDGIDLLLTGHQHRTLQGTVRNTTYVQPGFNGQLLAEINITGTKSNSGWTFDTVTELHNTVGIEPDSELLSILQDCETKTQTYLDTPVGFLDQDYIITDQLQARLHKHPLVTFINNIQLKYTKADIALCSLGNDVSGFKKEITIRDIIGTYIYPNTIVVKALSKQDILLALEKSAEFFDIRDNQIVIADEFSDPKLQLYAYDMYDPITYTITVSNPKGSRISNLLLHGKPLDECRLYKVVMNNYRASGGGEYFFIRDAHTVWDTQLEVIELLINYIVEQGSITLPTNNNITIIK